MNWKPIEAQYGGGESGFWSDYQKAGDKAVIAKLQASLGKPIEHEGYEYSVKTVKSKKDGKEYQFIQRKQKELGEDKPEKVAADITAKESPVLRNIAETLTIISELQKAILQEQKNANVLTEKQTDLIQKQVHLFEIITGDPNWFRTAAERQKIDASIKAVEAQED